MTGVRYSTGMEDSGGPCRIRRRSSDDRAEYPASSKVNVVMCTSPQSILLAHSSGLALSPSRTNADLSINHAEGSSSRVVKTTLGSSPPDRPGRKSKIQTPAGHSHPLGDCCGEPRVQGVDEGTRSGRGRAQQPERQWLRQLRRGYRESRCRTLQDLLVISNDISSLVRWEQSSDHGVRRI